MKKIFSRLKFAFLIVSALLALSSASLAQSSAVTAAQTTSAAQAPEKTQPRRPTKRATTPPARVTVIAGKSQVAPQVVTIVHRLTGVKMLRYLMRQGNEGDQIFTIAPDAISNDAHASIIAGWALDDGKTIAARLPQAVAEIEITQITETRAQSQARAATPSPFTIARPRLEPDLTVITGNGQKFRAHLIGLDGETGLSVLQVIGILPPAPAIKANELTAGQGIQIFAPEPLPREAETLSPLSRNTYVKLGTIDAIIATLAQSGSNPPDKLTVRGAKFSSEAVGGIACDRLGNTLGIVESIDGDKASILSTLTVRAAT